MYLHFTIYRTSKVLNFVMENKNARENKAKFVNFKFKIEKRVMVIELLSHALFKILVYYKPMNYYHLLHPRSFSLKDTL